MPPEISKPLSDISVSERLASSARRQVKATRRTKRTTAKKLRVVTYARISEDAVGKQGLGVKRQNGDTTELAGRLGFEVAERHVDNDISGGDFTDRAAYDEMLLAIERGDVQVVIAWAMDRFGREGLEQQEFLLICEVYGVRIITCEGDDIDYGSVDVDTDGAVAMATVKNAFATLERAKIRKRVRGKHRELAVAGKFSGGRRPFGYDKAGHELNPVEAALIREAVDMILAGKSLTHIAKDWSYRGVPTTTGGKWHGETVRGILLGARIAGKRVFQGEVVGDAAWPAIITMEEHQRLNLMNPRQQPHPPRTYLLSGGLLRCGLCGVALTSNPRKDHKGVVERRYHCRKQPPYDGCGRITVKAEPIEEAVTEMFFGVLDEEAIERVRERQADTSGRAKELIDEVAQLRVGKSNIAMMLALGKMDRSVYLETEAKVERDIAALSRELDEIVGVGAAQVIGTSAAEIKDTWYEMSVESQRSRLRVYLDHIVVGPPVRGQNFFNIDRLAPPVWRA